MSLYRKHRPKTFKEMVGNKSTVAALESIIVKKSPPHAFLFTGPAGTGKTTAARILLKELGCIGMDLMEIDSADDRGVDSIRAIRGRMGNLPQEGEKRGWFFDEAHELTSIAQDALLKGLEEPPTHCMVALATTEPQKLKKTLRTRCTIFNFSSLSELELVTLLQRVCKREKKNIDTKFLDAVAAKSDGSPRQALSIMERYIDQDPKTLDRNVIEEFEDEETEVIELCRALFQQKSWKMVAGILKNIKAEPETIRRIVIQYCSSCLLGGQEKAFLVLEPFLEMGIVTGMPSIVAAAYMAVKGE